MSTPLNPNQKANAVGRTPGPRSYQRKMQLANIARGMCGVHKDRPLASGSRSLCEQCLEKERTGTGVPTAWRKELWVLVDWSESDKAIARVLKVSLTAVRYQRLKAKGVQ